MPTSNPSRHVWHIGAVGGIPLLALALGAGDLDARSLERTSGTRAARDCGGQAATGMETCAGTTAAQNTAPGVATSCGQASPSAPSQDPGLSVAGPRPAPAAGRTPAQTRGKASAKPGGNRLMRRSGDGRVAPPTQSDEPRRGGVGTLIGITFA